MFHLSQVVNVLACSGYIYHNSGACTLLQHFRPCVSTELKWYWHSFIVNEKSHFVGVAWKIIVSIHSITQVFHCSKSFRNWNSRGKRKQWFWRYNFDSPPVTDPWKLVGSQHSLRTLQINGCLPMFMGWARLRAGCLNCTDSEANAK